MTSASTASTPALSLIQSQPIEILEMILDRAAGRDGPTAHPCSRRSHSFKILRLALVCRIFRDIVGMGHWKNIADVRDTPENVERILSSAIRPILRAPAFARREPSREAWFFQLADQYADRIHTIFAVIYPVHHAQVFETPPSSIAYLELERRGPPPTPTTLLSLDDLPALLSISIQGMPTLVFPSTAPSSRLQSFKVEYDLGADDLVNFIAGCPHLRGLQAALKVEDGMIPLERDPVTLSGMEWLSLAGGNLAIAWFLAHIVPGDAVTMVLLQSKARDDRNHVYDMSLPVPPAFLPRPFSSVHLTILRAAGLGNPFVFSMSTLNPLQDGSFSIEFSSIPLHILSAWVESINHAYPGFVLELEECGQQLPPGVQADGDEPDWAVDDDMPESVDGAETHEVDEEPEAAFGDGVVEDDMEATEPLNGGWPPGNGGWPEEAEGAGWGGPAEAEGVVWPVVNIQNANGDPAADAAWANVNAAWEAPPIPDVPERWTLGQIRSVLSVATTAHKLSFSDIAWCDHQHAMDLITLLVTSTLDGDLLCPNAYCVRLPRDRAVPWATQTISADFDAFAINVSEQLGAVLQRPVLLYVNWRTAIPIGPLDNVF